MGTTSADTYIKGNSIEAFFAETVILITGATGFLGKALLEKLLRSCPHVATIFVLIRSKQGQTIDQRFKKLLQNSVFTELRTTNPSAFDKVYPVEGDVSVPNLGLSQEDRNMLTQKVNIVFHSAATVKFNEPLKVAVNLNTKGTDRVIELCKNIKNLINIIHISTAYSNANLQDIHESIYTTKVKPSTVIDMCESLDEETLDVLEKKILENHPNTYTFTKNLAEQILLSKGKDLPIAIVRPSIVCAAQREPFPGWVDNFGGITGSITEISRGILRTILGNSNFKLDMVPIDYVVDTIICATWHSTMQQNNTIKIYNCTSNANPLRLDMLNKLINKHAIAAPSTYLMWYPGCIITSNKLIHNFMSVTLHIFPAIIGDFFLKLVGSKPQLMKSIKRAERMTTTGQFFIMREWNFHRSNMNDLMKKVKLLKDCDNFNVDIRDLEWDSYIEDYLSGIKKYVLNETPDSSNTARSRLLMFYWVHRIIQFSSIIVLLSMIMRVGH
ncbi:Putative fatty acyl-CoA reductase CG5065 [Anthophora retusa]